MSSVILEAQSLTKEYKHTIALDNIDLQIENGKIYGFIGQNGAAASLVNIFNGMVYDSTFLLVIISSILSLILGQEFSCRTLNLEVSAGHSRKEIFASQIIIYLIAFNIMALLYPVAGCFPISSYSDWCDMDEHTDRFVMDEVS